ncbi:MAG: glycosyltransferase family 4 protein [Fibrobacter sp.]|nr:glycosyltransferase family 4 protein [Fibrobacter sp.]
MMETKQNKHLVLVYVQNPWYYPHIERHWRALSKKYVQITVLACFSEAPQQSLSEVNFVSMGELPQGIIGFLKFMLKVWRWLLWHKWDICQATDPPCLFPAALVSKIKFRPLVYFSMELFQHTPALTNKKLKRKIWYKLEKFGVKNSSKVVTVNQSVADRLQAKFKLNTVNVVRSIPEVQKEQKAPVNLRSRFTLAEDDFILIYQGALEPGRGIEFCCDALKQRSKVHFIILGLGELESWVQERAEKQSNVHYAGAFDFVELMRWATGAQAGLVWIEPIAESYRLSLPGKLFEYMHNLTPVLASPLPEISRIVQEYQVGIVAKDLKKEGFLQALDALVAKKDNFGEDLLRAQKELSWEQEQKKLLEVYHGF